MKLEILLASLTLLSGTFQIESKLVRHAGSRTPYSYLVEELPHWSHPAEYQPLKLWFLTRHGTRYPKQEEIQLMNKRLPQFDSNWKSQVKLEDAWKLHNEGKLEMYFLGERIREKFSKLFTVGK